MGRVAFECGVQHADIEPARQRRRVGAGQIVHRGGLLVAAAMQGHPQGINPEGAGFAGVKRVHVGGQRELFGHLAVGIVVAKQQVHRDVCQIQAAHLPAKKVTRVVVFPAAVIQVTRNHHEVNRFLNGDVHQPGKRIAGDIAQQINRGVLVSREAGQGAVKVNVCRVDKFQTELLSTIPNLE